MLNNLGGVIGLSVPCSMPMSNVWMNKDVVAASDDKVKLLLKCSRDECKLVVSEVGT
jgi:hypothetical protein